MIEIAPIAFMRGRTLEDCFVILDEAQNTTKNSNENVFNKTRSKQSKWLLVGDITQIDLVTKNDSGLLEAEKQTKSKIQDIGFVYLNEILMLFVMIW